MLNEDRVKTNIPALFTDVKQVVPDIHIDLKYFTGDNFLGCPVDGYEAELCLITLPAAQALARVQQTLAVFGLGLSVFDAYRPQRAVDHFIRWTEDDSPNVTQDEYFPGLEPKDLFQQGYLVKHSSHSRGSTVDLTLIDLETGIELNMGTRFDFFGPASWFDCPSVHGQARANRMLLQQVMVQNGFLPFQQEWWHFTLQDEPYPDQYFDFPIS